MIGWGLLNDILYTFIGTGLSPVLLGVAAAYGYYIVLRKE